MDGVVLAALAAVAVWLAVVAPLALGRDTLFFRDVFHTHLPLKAFGAEQLHAGRIPATNPTWGLGQPFRGNPNALAFYPGNLLYLLLPFWPAFNLHYALHWLLAGVAMWALARTLGQGRPAALLAGLTYAGSGWMLAALTFYNIVAVAAWWPLVLAAGVRGGRRALAGGALACGMALLAGEPMTAALGAPVLVAFAVSRHGAVRGLVTSLAIGAGGLLVALPQVVATLRILPTTERGGGGLIRSQASYFSLELERLAELVLPYPFGVPGRLGPESVGAVGVLAHLPFYFSLHFGIVALVLAGVALRRRRALGALAAGGMALAWLGGLSGGAVLALSGGVFRSPEKFLFWTALAVPLLAGWGLEQIVGRWRAAAVDGSAADGWGADGLRAGGSRADGRRTEGSAGDGSEEAEPPAAGSRLPVAVAAAGAGLLLAGLLFAITGSGPTGLAARALGGLRRVAGAGGEVALATAQAWRSQQVRSLVLAALLLGLLGLALRARRPALVVAVQLAALLQLLPLLPTDAVAAYAAPADWAGAVRSGDTVIQVRGTYPPWKVTGPPPVYPSGGYALDARREARELAPAPGVLHGLSYPAAPDLDGMMHRFHLLALFRMSQGSWPERVAWARVLGADLLVSPEPVDAPALEPVAAESSYGAEIRLYRVRGAAPRAWWPRRIETAATPPAAASLIESMAEADDLAVLPRNLPGGFEQSPDGSVRVVGWEPDRVELAIESAGGGVAVVRRAFQTLWRAQDGFGADLPVLPVDLTLLGVVVPAGSHQVVLSIDDRPEKVAGAVAFLAGLALAVTGLPRRWRLAG